MKLKTSHKTFLGLLLGAAVLFFLKEYTIIPAVMLMIGLVSLLFPIVANIIDGLVSGLIGLIGRGLSTVLLFLTYYLVLSPVALIASLFGKNDSLGLKKPEGTNFKSVEKKFEPEGFEKMW
ncbi:hypothetical protein J1N09_01675 [Aureitalea sp. L0-47]|uniref:hypothetical protein n=1 Tax=Aureitalea sp. L0-47 TaxID=2816962 RepID=UPI002237B00E|nr:hypothetical protein [Aureitalea sp. L0-47]MCW5518530.1 hypothetical protein [Aureitalea sp. L0-47]